MNGPARKIEIFAPFNQAIELTRLILFRPFDVTKWLVIGFAAFLSGWLNSGGGSINPWSFRGWNTSTAQRHSSNSGPSIPTMRACSFCSSSRFWSFSFSRSPFSGFGLPRVAVSFSSIASSATARRLLSHGANFAGRAIGFFFF